MDKSINKQVNNDDAHIVESATANEREFKPPTIDQFMELVTAENTTLAATPSGYNVYNKYNKTS